MKKNVMMRIAACLLVCVLASTCGISGTFAKYVTSGSGSDVARIAKFGVSVTAEATMFLDKYETDADAAIYTGDYSVNTSNSDKLVAPGTDGNMVSLVITGQPEVATLVTYTPVVELGNNWIDKDDINVFYCPLKITVKTNAATTTLCGLDYDSADAFEDAIEALIVAAKMTYDPNQNLNNVNDDLQISWEWPFQGEGYVGGTGHLKQTDEKDTFLGDRAAGDIGNAGTISIALTVTIEQID